MPLDLSNFSSTAKGIATTMSQTAGTIAKGVNTLKSEGFGALLRSANLPAGGETGNKLSSTAAEFSSGAQRDWRVRLSLPSGEYQTSSLLAPLRASTGTNGLVFPFTPSINITHLASYQTTSPVHNNYPFLSYENSKVENINISGDFYCEDANDANYWIAAVHYLRSVSKMKYGPDSDAGAPPPVVKLNGYGDYVFKNVPVVVTSFTIELPNNVDYIATGLGAPSTTANQTPTPSNAAGNGVAWAPVKSTLNVVLQPIYSREQVRNFSLDKFVKGDYVVGGTNGTGFI